MNTLALDLGTKCGWALSSVEKFSPSTSGVWKLAPGRFDSAGVRFVRFRELLISTIKNFKIEHIVYEEVRNHMGVDAAHVYGGFVSILQTAAIDNAISYTGVPVGTIKKHATGKGNADKPMMVKAAIKLYPAINVLDDNHADALCLLHYAMNNIIF